MSNNYYIFSYESLLMSSALDVHRIAHEASSLAH